ncbi:UNVERIFIED_CONTAM: hypothetical protein Scaly_2901600 [Sesamum calycinum]|uniref:Reverse transcriptase domain-containing protein n=1 Tax=Sesamum calycinum TaxID=2727403 RepID=A0AAW2L4E3_9LAMI
MVKTHNGDYDLIPRRDLWSTLRTLSIGIGDEPWLVLGDFNAVIDDSEVRGRAADTSASMAEFRSCILDTGLVHLPFTGNSFTWHNCSEGTRSLWKRLDRMLVNEVWLDSWPGASYISALPSTSDHSPLILNGTTRDADHVIFRITGTAMYEIVCKLKALKVEFRRQRKLKGDLTANVMLAKRFLDKAQTLFATFNVDILLHLVKCCRLVYSEAIKLETSMLKQRAKLRWMKYGDQNSKVFFRKISATRAKQRVFQVTKATGEVLTDKSEVTHEFVSYFQTLLGGTRPQRMVDISFLRQELKHILTTDEANLLVAPVTGAEIKAAFFDIDEDSAPGPDGYTSAFYKAAWPVIGHAISEAIGEFFRTGKLLKQINTTLLALIPKVNLPTHVSDYRPISCCNVLYKAITKIIVKRMQLVLHLLVDYSQNAFVPGRSISDNILLAQELLAGYNQVRLPPRCTLKVDIQKAYDSVEWDFLLEVLKILNFPTRFIIWIEQCISTATFSISLNGSIHGFFKGGRGLRQGDPMSPYLFVLVMEIWSSLLRFRVHNTGHFQYHWKCQELGILNLCFADDVLLFCKAHLPSIQVFKDTLREFASLSGLTVNPAKSQIILSKSVQQERQQIIAYLGFQEGFLPVKYLGVPLTASRLTIADCSPLINKVDARLAGWNHLNLSYAGRVQLIKSVLQSLHTYWASVFILPKGILNILEEKMRTFLWQGPHGRGNAKVAWAQVCKPKEEGGLGIRSICVSNQALILKHLWKLLQNDGTSIWVDWIQHYRLHNSTLWTFKNATGSWGWKKLLKLRPLLQRGVLYRVGNGSTFSLWQDIWHDQGPLCLSFPRGPAITGLPLHSPLSSVLHQGQWCWPSANDEDIRAITAHLPPTHPTAADIICWRNSPGKFTLESATLLIQTPTPRVHWHGLLQGKYKIARHGFILWLAILEKLSTLDKPWVLRNDDGCLLCDGHFSESHDHLFFQCWYSRRCLSILNSKIKFQWPFVEWKKGITWASKRWRGDHLINSALRAVLAALVYHLWAERNSRKFTATSSSAETVVTRVLEDVRLRIMVANFLPSIQSRSLYRIWKIAWPLGQ